MITEKTERRFTASHQRAALRILAKQPKEQPRNDKRFKGARAARLRARAIDLMNDCEWCGISQAVCRCT